MTADEFRKLALSLPETSEGSHMNHPDFRVRGKIFATISPDEKSSVVMLTPEQQTEFADYKPNMFQPVQGAWGRQGSTRVKLQKATKMIVKKALVSAWRNKAPKNLSLQYKEL